MHWSFNIDCLTVIFEIWTRCRDGSERDLVLQVQRNEQIALGRHQRPICDTGFHESEDVLPNNLFSTHLKVKVQQ